MLNLLIQAAQQVPAEAPTPEPSFMQRLFDNPQDVLYGYLAVLFLLWLLARRGRQKQKDFSAEAQNVLNEKFQKGEIDRATYEKYRQELSLRLKKD